MRAIRSIVLVVIACFLTSCTRGFDSPVIRVDGEQTLTCERGIAYEGGIGRCFHDDYTFTVFKQSESASVIAIPGAVVPQQPAKRWIIVDKFDALIGRIEGSVERWLTDMEARPLTTGFKTLLTLLVLRLVYRWFIRRG